MSEMMCPNCGHHLAPHRTERQRAGSREVVLHWVICAHCRHVALHHWSYDESQPARRVVEMTEQPAPTETSVERRRSYPDRVVLRSFVRPRP